MDMMWSSLACLRLIVPGLLAGLLFTGCSAEKVLTFSEYREAFTQAAADYFLRCGFVDASRVSALRDMSLLAVPPELQVVIDEEVAIGRVQLNPDCFAPLKSAPCDLAAAAATIEGCVLRGKQFIPQVPPGRLCRLPGECTSGYCDLGAVTRPCGTGVCSSYLPVGLQCGTGKGACDPATSSCWQGTCRQRGGTNAECRTEADCDANHFCRGAQDRRCAPRARDLAPGAPCDPEQAPDGCKSGARCLQAVPGQGEYTCTPLRDVGGPCLSPQECVPGAVCVGASVAERRPGTCQRQGGPGQACDLNAGAICQLTLYCGKDGKCKPAGALGQACEDVDGGQACLSGLCSASGGSAGVCAQTLPEGSSCTAGGQCRSGICDSKTSTCLAVCAPLR